MTTHLLPGSPAAPTEPPLERTLTGSLPELATPSPAAPSPQRRLLELNEPLAAELGLDPDWLRTARGTAWLAGHAGKATQHTAALAYAGLQFGQPSPVLGDGRALLLGERMRVDGRRADLHLKGTGRTPFSRAGADGKLPLTAALREMVVGEALHALGIPSTRALAVISTGERIQRREPRPEPAGILVRVGASHLRYGTVQYAAWHHGEQLVQRLVDYAVGRHAPDWQRLGPLGPAADDPTDPPALRLLTTVAEAHARLVAQWSLIGFVHGVMNTDNMTLSGEAIDFGPCAFLDAYSADAVFSSIDAQGRYRLRHQPTIAAWNTARLAEALLPQLSRELGGQDAAIDRATAIVEAMPERTRAHQLAGMGAKLGLPKGTSAPAGLVDDLLERMEERQLDWTLTFRRLTGAAAGSTSADLEADLGQWLRAWRQAVPAPDAARMDRANPRVIPRNGHLERALRWVLAGDTGPVRDLLAAVREPGSPNDRFEHPPEGSTGAFITFCGT